MKLNLNFQSSHKLIKSFCLLLLTVISSFFLVTNNPVFASINDDTYDGNIFILYAGNGSLVPPRLSLKESLAREMPTLLVYYVDDSSDCKQYSIVISRLQEFYGRAANIVPVAVDSIEQKSKYNKDEVGYYYKGLIPQTVLLDQKGKVIFDQTGQANFEQIDDKFREVFNLLPRSESVELKLKTFNEFNSELVEEKK